MKCLRCTFENPEGMYFCGNCGYELSILSKPPAIAESLEEKLKKIQRYLPPGLTKKILARKASIEGERRQATIMFCDMKGFVPLTQKLGPEETFALMEKVFDILIPVVHRYEGTVNEIRGDGILALFGVLDALEEAPQRAIRAAIAIHKEIADLNQRIRGETGNTPLLLRVGINTGTVVIGTVGNDLRVQFAMVGDTVNMASRMENLAEPGTTYVTEETYRLTKDLFHCLPLGKFAVKGKDEPIPVYRVLSAREDVQRPRLGSERRIYSSMVGRQSDLNRLELQVMKAINGQGSVVNIVGEAGIGKSRLLAELKRREVMKGVTFIEGRAISIGRNLSFYPVVDILKHWAGIRGDDGEAIAFEKLLAAVRRLFPEDHGEILPFIATLMGMKLSGRHAEKLRGIAGDSLKKLVTKSMRNLLVKATEATPLVIACEDFHWADTSTIELMESLFPLAQDHRLIFLNLFRPEYTASGDRIIRTVKENGRSYCFEMVLEPLSRTLSETLVREILRKSELDHVFATKIAERTGGNPFFIEEVVRSLIDEQTLVPKRDRVHLSERAAAIEIPATVEDVLMARIDRLEEETRDLVKIASVIGRSFYYRVLLEVASVVDAIDARLSYLQEIQLLHERFRMGELEYLFNHALVQEVAYRSILPTKLKDLHLNVARSIEKIFEERLYEFYGMLAYHYSRGEKLEKAEEYLIKAGEEALKSSASNEALYYYREALSIYQRLRGDSADPEKIAMLEKNIGLALFNRGHYTEAIEHFDKALSYYWGDLPKNSWTTTFMFVASLAKLLLALYFPSLWFKKNPTQKDNEAIDLFYKRAEILVVINPKRFFIESFFFCNTVIDFDLAKFRLGAAVFVGVSAMFSFTGISHRIGKRILDYAKPRLAPDDAKQGIVFDLMDTQHHFLKGEWNAIAGCNEDLVKRSLEIGETFYASQHYYWHGLSKVHRGYFDAARVIVTKLGELGEAYENDVYRLLKYLLNINLLIESRALKEATVQVNQGIDLVERNNWPQSALTMYSLEASICLLTQQIEKARASLEKAGEMASEITAAPIQSSFFLRSRFEYDIRCLEDSARNGDGKEYSLCRRKALKSGKMLLRACRKAALYRTESYKLMGIYNWLCHDGKSALDWWQKAVDEGERLGARPQLARTYAEIGRRFYEVRAERGRPSAVEPREFLEKARHIFTDLGLHHDLEEIDSWSGRTAGLPSHL